MNFNMKFNHDITKGLRCVYCGNLMPYEQGMAVNDVSYINYICEQHPPMEIKYMFFKSAIKNTWEYDINKCEMLLKVVKYKLDKLRIMIWTETGRSSVQEISKSKIGLANQFLWMKLPYVNLPDYYPMDKTINQLISKLQTIKTFQ